jgi:hypothetical protein
MDTIADMITRRLRDIEAQFSAEVSSPHPQAGGAIAEASARAAAKERRLWDALQGDRTWVWTPDGHKTLREITELASGLKAEMRQERATNGDTAALKWMAELDRTMENLITVAATRQSAREAEAARADHDLGCGVGYYK